MLTESLLKQKRHYVRQYIAQVELSETHAIWAEEWFLLERLLLPDPDADPEWLPAVRWAHYQGWISALAWVSSRGA